MHRFGETKFVTYRPGELFPPAIEYLGGFDTAMETVAANPELVKAVVMALDGVLLTAYLDVATLVVDKTLIQTAVGMPATIRLAFQRS